MNSDPRSYQQTETVDTAVRVTEAPTRNLEDVLESCTMKGSVRLPREMRRGMALLCLVLTVSLLLGTVLILVGGASMWVFKPYGSTQAHQDEVSDPSADPKPTYPYADGKWGAAVFPTARDAESISASLITSSHAVLVDVNKGAVVASLLPDESIYPASMTKVMTLIVVVENLPHESSLSDTITISKEVYNSMTAEGASGFGFKPGTQLTVEALLYALMLRSDGIAATELARYVAGSESAFVKLMNEKAAAMGLSGTHFENPTGLYHPQHRSTVRNIASIMAYAMDMRLCRRILTEKAYETTAVLKNGETEKDTFYHNLLVTQFDNISPNQPTALTVIAGKTGYTPESGYCLVTYAEGDDGHAYIAVTTQADNYAACIDDYIAIYNGYADP